MESVQALQNLLNNIRDESDSPLSREKLEEYFHLLVSTADSPEVLDSLCWETGVSLLVLSSDSQHQLFDQFGYLIISKALFSGFSNGCLPRGLQWFTYGFVPGDVDGDIMLSVLSNPTVEYAIKRGIDTCDFKLDLDLLGSSDSKLSEATVRFLANLHRFGLNRLVQLQWAARLVEHLPPETPARIEAEKLVLEGLIKSNRYINAFYWLQKFFNGNKSSEVSDDIFLVVTEVINIVLSLEDDNSNILSEIGFENDFVYLLMSSERAHLLMTFVTLWLQFFKGFQIQNDLIEVGISLLWNDYPTLSLFIKRLSDWASKMRRDEKLSGGKNLSVVEIINFAKQKKNKLIEIKDDLEQTPFYRRRRLPVELWIECRDEFFLPLLQSIESAKSITRLEVVINEISEFDAIELVKNSDIYKDQHSKSRKLYPDEIRMLTTDFEKYIEKFADLVDVSVIANHLQSFIRDLDDELYWPSLHQEYAELIEKFPSLADGLQRFFVPIIEEWEAVKEQSGV